MGSSQHTILSHCLKDVSRIYKDEQKLVQVSLIEGRKILGAFNQKLRQYAEKKIKDRKQMELIQANVGSKFARIAGSFHGPLITHFIR